MNTQAKQLPIPPHFDSKNAQEWGYRPDLGLLLSSAEKWRKEHGIQSAAKNARDVHLLLIDVQKDFSFPEGTLYVAGRSGTGAVDDSARIAEFMYRNLVKIKRITTTLDTHFSHQIFFPSFWLNQDGNHPDPHTIIVVDDIRNGKYRPDPAMAWWLCGGDYSWLLRQAEFYCSELEKAGKYELYLWPFHTILGTEGHALVGVIEEARMFHSFVRGVQSWGEVKGGNPLTENYSVLQPEVLARHDGKPLAQKNTRFIETLIKSDAVIIAGQADSHCVKSTIDDLLGEIQAQDPGLAKKVYIMIDCMSAVTVPDGSGGFIADFTQQAEEAHQRFADAGMNLVKSTDPIEDWLDIN